MTAPEPAPAAETPKKKAAGPTREQRFVRKRIGRWRELQELLDRAGRRGLRSLDGNEVRRLGELYRTATSDLAFARTLELTHDTISHINRLCTVAHDLIYAGQRRGPAGKAFRFFGGGFAALVRKSIAYHAFALAIFLLSGVAGYVAFRADPALAERTIGTHIYERAERGKALTGEERQYLEIPTLTRPMFSSAIIANNVQATVTAFAFGAAFCIGAIFVLVFNGVHLAGVIAIYAEVGAPDLILTWAASHGPIELTAVFIAAGAGMRLGLSLLVPGRRTRAQAFKETGVESVLLLCGTSVMLVIAGLLEGFVSPTRLPDGGKYAIAALSVLAMIAYFGFAGRPRTPSASHR